MLFVYPHLLWLLLLAPALAYAGHRSGGSRRTLVAWLRAAGVAALALAVARPMLPWRSTTPTAVVIVDVSPAAASAAADAARHDWAAAAAPARPTVIAFASRAAVVTDPATLADPAALAALRKRLADPLWDDDAPPGSANPSANLAAALQLAAAQVPPDGRGSVVLYGDGESDHGDAAAEAYRLAERGVAVGVVPSAPAVGGGPATAVRQVSVPGTASVGQTVDATVQLDAAAAGRVTVRLAAGDGSPASVAATVTPGPNQVRVALPLPKAGLAAVRAAVQPDGGGAVGGPVLAAIDVRPAPRVLLVQDGPEAGLRAALDALLGPAARVTAVPPDRVAATPMDGVGAVVLADVPADHLPAAAQATLRRAVLDGTGLVVTGAARSFGPGGYDDSPLAPLLPVRMPQQVESIDPSTTLVLIFDTSGSMKGDRIDLAKEVARMAVSHLRPQDKVGVVEFYGGRRWAAPIQSASNLSVIGRTLDRLTAGGGTVLYPAVEEAAFALRNVHTRTKNVFILSDGGVEDAPFGPLVRQMAEDGVAVTTVKVGTDDSPNPMAAIARWGQGRYYEVPDQFALPDVTLKQPQQSLLSPVVRTASAVVAGDDPLVRAAVLADGTPWDPVQGYVRTAAKPTADVLLRTAGGDPLVARWRYGAGFVAAVPTQLGSGMTRGLQDQPQFARLLAGLLRQADGGRGAPLQVRAAVRPAGVEVDVVAADADPAFSTRPITVTLDDDQGRPCRTTAAAEPIAAGHWDVLLPGVTAGAYGLTAQVVGSAAVGHAGVAVPPPAAVRAADRPLLDRLAGFAPLAAERAARLPADRPVFVDLQKALAVAAVVLLLLLVAARRWPSTARLPLPTPHLP